MKLNMMYCNDLIELDKQIEKHKVIKTFQDGVTDALISGVRDEEQTHHYYSRGYDFGIALYVELNNIDDGYMDEDAGKKGE